MKRLAILFAAFALSPAFAAGLPADPSIMQASDVFNLEYATDPQLSPDGRSVAYVRRSFDIMSDTARSNIWLIDVASGQQRPVLSGTASFSSPRWSPDGKRLAYVSGVDAGSQIYVRWMDSNATARITDLQAAPSDLSWSPDGKSLAFAMFVKDEVEPFAKMPEPPEGAKWAPKPIVIDRMNYRGDGEGYFEQGTSQIFIVAADGGTPRQVTADKYQYGGTASWGRDGRTLYVSADRNVDWDRQTERPEIYAVNVASGVARALTANDGLDIAPRVSPDGRHIAYLRNTENLKAHQPFELWVMAIDGSGNRRLASSLDESVDDLQWKDSSSIAFVYDEDGVTKLGEASLSGGHRTLATGLGGEDMGRPYAGASFSAAAGAIAFNVTSPSEPADVAVYARGKRRRLTRLNDDLNALRQLSDVEELWVTAPDGTRTQAWIMKPPHFRATRKYPLILEIHGGPHANYGPRFAAEMQLYAAAGYVVLYTNPRGSTSYGAAFGNMIDKAYPGGDYADLMAAVDSVVAQGYIDPGQLYVTGGSGGGVLTAWIVGNTDRFRAAVVAKPVINWTSFVLDADGPAYYHKYWFGKKPWEAGAQADYWARSPLSLVGNVKTPTMLLTGEADYRTPISESEQYYAALQIEGVETAMVRIPEASHALVDRPSRLIAKVNYILAWFEKHKETPAAVAAAP